MIIERASGAHLTLKNGKTVFDAASGAVNVNIGYGQEAVIEAIRRVLGQLSYLHPDDKNESRLALTQRLIQNWLPQDHVLIGYTCTGAEGIELAIKAALVQNELRGLATASNFLALSVSYHGASFLTMGIGGGRKILPSYAPYLPLTHRLQNGVGMDAMPASTILKQILQDFPSVSAIVIESIVGSSGGALELPPEYWLALNQYRAATGVPIILDETMTGFGRTGRNFGFQHFGIDPDFIVSGKGLAAGYAALTMVSGKKSSFEAIETANKKFMTTTMSGQPAAVAAAHAVLDMLERNELVERTAHLGQALEQEAILYRGIPGIRDIRGRGLFWAFEVEALTTTAERDQQRQMLLRSTLSKGVNVYPAGIESDRPVILFAPPMTASRDHILNAFKTVAYTVAHVGRMAL